MTTENLDQELIRRLRLAAHGAANDVRRRSEELTNEIEQADTQAHQDDKDLAIARRLMEQRHRDRRVRLDEEADQLDYVLVGGPTVRPAAPAPGTMYDGTNPTGYPTVAPVAAVAVPASASSSTVYRSNQSESQPEGTEEKKENIWPSIVAAVIAGLIGLFIGCNTIFFHPHHLAWLVDGLYIIGWIAIPAWFVGRIVYRATNKKRESR